VIFRNLPAALHDLDCALAYYTEVRPDLAGFLMDEIAQAKEQIACFPFAWRSHHADLASYPLHRFPYSIIYHADGHEILIVAYAHNNRRPDYWKDRLKGIR
jgi:hypothetical protein